MNTESLLNTLAASDADDKLAMMQLALAKLQPSEFIVVDEYNLFGYSPSEIMSELRSIDESVGLQHSNISVIDKSTLPIDDVTEMQATYNRNT